MRAATALAFVLSLAHALIALAQVPPTPSPIEGPLTQTNTTPEQIETLFPQLRHPDGSLPHLLDPIFGNDFPALGEDCVNGAGVPVWHWHRFDIDGFFECGHGAVIIAQQNGGAGVPEVFSPEFLAGELLRDDFLSYENSNDLRVLEDQTFGLDIDSNYFSVKLMGGAALTVGSGQLPNNLELSLRIGLDRLIEEISGPGSGFKIADNESPRPRDRVFFIYNYFGDGAGSNTPGGIPAVQRSALGFEKTFFDALPSVEIRAPFLPSIQVDPSTNRVVMHYTEFSPDGTIQNFEQSFDGGKTWESAGRIQDGTGIRIHSDFTFGPDGTILSFSSTYDGKDEFELNTRRVSGQTYNDLGVPDGATDHRQRFQPILAVDPTSGNLAIAWEQAKLQGSDIQCSFNNGKSWTQFTLTSPGLLDNSVDPDLVFTPQGDLYATFSNDSGGDFDPVVRQRQPDGSWTTIEGTGPNGAVIDTPGQSREPHIGLDGQGRLYVTWTERGGSTPGDQILGQRHDGSMWNSFDPFANRPVEFPSGIIPPDTQDFYRFSLPGGGVRFFGIGPDGTFNGSLTLPPPSLGGARWGDYSVMEGVGPNGPVAPIADGDGKAAAPATNADDKEYPLAEAFDKMFKSLTKKAFITADQKTLADILKDTLDGSRSSTIGGVTTPGKSLDDAAKGAVEKNKDALQKNPGAKGEYENLQKKAQADAQSGNAHDARRGRQWQRALDVVGKAAGWPTSAELKSK